MALINVTGNQAGAQNWNWDTDEYHATGIFTLLSGCVLTITGNANPFRYDGNFYMNCAAGSQIISNGTATAKKTWQANANPRAGAYDGPYFPLAAGAPAAGCSITFNVFRDSLYCCYFQNSTNAITFNDNEILDSTFPMTILSTVAQSFARCRVSRCNSVGFAINTASAITLTDCDGSVNLTGSGNHTLTRHRGTNSEVAQPITIAGTGTVLVDEPYVRGSSTNGIVQSGAATGTVQNGVVIGNPDKRTLNYGIYRTAGTLASSGNDIVDCLLEGIYGASTSDNDHLAGNNKAAQSNIDTVNGATTSTSTPGQFSTLGANRTNARATPNKPLTTSAVSSGSVTANGATIAWTSGIKSSSIVRYGTVSGVYTMRSIETENDWTLLDGGTKQATAHSVPLVNLAPGTTYYYQVGGFDPLNRAITWSAEQSFATTAAAGGGAARSGFAGAGMRVS